MRHRSSAAFALALLVAVGGAVGVLSGDAASAAPATGDDVQALTLITGDQVTVDGDRMLVKPRKGIQFFQFRATRPPPCASRSASTLPPRSSSRPTAPRR